jgi:hypothetical protein
LLPVLVEQVANPVDHRPHACRAANRLAQRKLGPCSGDQVVAHPARQYAGLPRTRISPSTILTGGGIESRSRRIR